MTIVAFGCAVNLLFSVGLRLESDTPAVSDHNMAKTRPGLKKSCSSAFDLTRYPSGISTSYGNVGTVLNRDLRGSKVSYQPRPGVPGNEISLRISSGADAT
jgi:hypothetical protein